MTEVPTYDEEILEKLRDISQDPKHKLWGDKWKAQREVVQEYYQKGVTDTEARYQGLVEGYMKLTKNEELVLTRLLLRLTDENGWLNDKWIDDASVHEIAVIHEIAARLRKG